MRGLMWFVESNHCSGRLEIQSCSPAHLLYKLCFDHNPFVHSFFLASMLHNFVSYSSIDSIDCLTWEINKMFVHSFSSCGLDLVFWYKIAIFYHNSFVHSFFLASKFSSFLAQNGYF